MADAAIKQAIHVMGMDASSYVQGAQAVDRANEQLIGSTAKVTTEEEKVNAATRTTADGFAKLEARYDPLIRAEQRRAAAIQQATRYLQEGSVSQTRYADHIQRVNDVYDAQIRKLSGVKAANDNAARGVSGMGDAFGAVTRLAGAFGVALSVMGLVQFARSTIDTVGGLGELAEQLGVSTQSLQVYQYAGLQAGVKTEQLQQGVARLTRTIGDAADGQNDAIDTMRRYGIGVLDAGGNIRSTDAVMIDVAKSVSALATEQERGAAAAAFFGDKAGQRLLPLLRELAGGYDEMAEKARNAGVVAGDDLIKKFDDISDRMTVLKMQLTVETAGHLEIWGRAWTKTVDQIAEQLKRLYDAATFPARLLDRLTGGAYSALGRSAAAPVAAGPVLVSEDYPMAAAGNYNPRSKREIEAEQKEREKAIAEEERLRKAADDKRVAEHARALAEIDKLDQEAREAGLKGEELLAVKREEAYEKYNALLERKVISEEDYSRARLLIEERYEKDVQVLRDRAAEEEERRRQQELDRQAARIERQSERVLDQISDSAGDILFDYLEDRSGSFWQTFLRLGKRAFADLVATTAVNTLFGSTVRGAVAAAPGIFGISGSAAGAGGSATGGGLSFTDLGSMFSMGNNAGLFGNAFGGITTAIDSFGAGAFGLSSVAGGGNSLYGLAGVEAGAIDAGFIAGEGAAGLGGASLSSLLGGVGLGFGAGTLLNGLLGGNPTGGMIGSGVGAVGGAIIGSIVPGIGTILGGLLGGGGGGLLGGLFGGGQGFSGGTARIGIDESGRLYNSGANGKNFDLGPVNAWADQFAATINQVFDTLGLKFGAAPTSFMTGHDFGQGAHVTTETNIASIFGWGQVQSGLPKLDELIAAHFKAEYDSPSGATADQLTADLASMVTAFKTIEALKNPANDFVDVLKQIADQFDPLIVAAKKWGAAAEDIGLIEQRRAQSVELARMQLSQPYNLGAASIVDFLNAQSLTANSSLSPLDRLSEAQRQFGDVLGQARGGDVNQLGNLTQSAGAVLGISRDLYGSTGQGAAMERWVRDSLLSVAELFSSSTFQDKQIAAISQQTQVQQDGYDRMVAALGRVQSEISRLRADMSAAA